MTGTTLQGVRSDPDRRWAIAIALFAMGLTMPPYLFGWAHANGRVYMWQGYNLFDAPVYLSWMRQASHGSFRAYNLFTNDPQTGMPMNPYFGLLGMIAGVTHLPIIGVYHAARLITGFAALMVAWGLIRHTISDRLARRLALLMVCFSAGLGWLPSWWSDRVTSPVDGWMPETITFESLYTAPIFCVALLLQILAMRLLWEGLTTGRRRYAVQAGLAVFALGLIHPYDVITVTAVWIAILAIDSIRNRSTEGWRQAVIAAVIGLPGFLGMYLVVRLDPVLYARANVPTLSPSIHLYLAGYGLTLALALVGLLSARTALTPRPPLPSTREGEEPLIPRPHLPQADERESETPYAPAPSPQEQREGESAPIDTRAIVMLAVWMVVNFAVAYLPPKLFPFQRKMIEGEHIPIALLAGIGTAMLFRRLGIARSSVARPAAMAGLVAVLGISNWRFMVRDMIRDVKYDNEKHYYMRQGELEALQWVAAHAGPSDAVQPIVNVTPVRESRFRALALDNTLASFTPVLVGRRVWCGHWGETPRFNEKINTMLTLWTHRYTDEQREAIVRDMRVRYLIFAQKEPNDPFGDFYFGAFRGIGALPPYLKLVHSNPEADVYEVD